MIALSFERICRLRKDREMRITKATFMMMGLLLTCLSFVSTARADGARSYISPSGSDNRPCSRNQPCRTFDAALAKTDAGGEIVAMETGTYDPATITKSITLAAAPGADVSIRTTGNAVTVNANTGDTIVLRGLRLGGPGRNVVNSNGVLVNLESPSCCISVSLENTIITDFEEGVQMNVGVAGRLLVTDSVFRSNKTGINFSAGGTEAHGAAIERSRFERNEIGILTSTGNPVTVSNSIASGNGVGFQANPGGKFDIFQSVITKNSTGIDANGGAVRIGYSSVMGNSTGIAAGGGIVHSMGNNMIVSNDIDISGAINFSTFLAR